MSAAPLSSSGARLSGAALLALFVFLPRVAHGAVPFVEGPRCRVSLDKLSYDDPGADDAEFLELRVERGAFAEPSVTDAGADAAGAPEPDAALTLGACGLAAIELVDGASGACTLYRAIPVAEIAVPEDDRVVVCSASVPFAAPCDVTASGRTALKAGWLQNGPNDGLRLRGTSGGAVEIGYEPPPACFAPSALRLADEAGETGPGSGVDDVNTLCGSRYVLLGAAESPLRGAPACPVPSTPDPLAPGDAGPDSEGGPRPVTPAAVERDPARRPDVYVPERAPAPRQSPSEDDPLFRIDASVDKVPDLRPLPQAPGCTMAPDGAVEWRRAPVGALLAGLVVVRRVFRRRRRRLRASRSALRAGSSARCGFRPSR